MKFFSKSTKDKTMTDYAKFGLEIDGILAEIAQHETDTKNHSEAAVAAHAKRLEAEERLQVKQAELQMALTGISDFIAGLTQLPPLVLTINAAEEAERLAAAEAERARIVAEEAAAAEAQRVADAEAARIAAEAEAAALAAEQEAKAAQAEADRIAAEQAAADAAKQAEEAVAVEAPAPTPAPEPVLTEEPAGEAPVEESSSDLLAEEDDAPVPPAADPLTGFGTPQI